MPMTRFEPQTSGNGSDHCANWATATCLLPDKFGEFDSTKGFIFKWLWSSLVGWITNRRVLYSFCGTLWERRLKSNPDLPILRQRLHHCTAANVQGLRSNIELAVAVVSVQLFITKRTHLLSLPITLWFDKIEQQQMQQLLLWFTSILWF